MVTVCETCFYGPSPMPTGTWLCYCRKAHTGDAGCEEVVSLEALEQLSDWLEEGNDAVDQLSAQNREEFRRCVEQFRTLSEQRPPLDRDISAQDDDDV